MPRTVIISRLKRIEGQLKGIQNMVSEERPCIDVMTQLSSVNAALHSIAGLVLKNYAQICSREEIGDDIGDKLARAVEIWMGGRLP